MACHFDIMASFAVHYDLARLFSVIPLQVFGEL